MTGENPQKPIVQSSELLPVQWTAFSNSPNFKKPAENYIGNIRVAALQNHLFIAAREAAHFALTRYAQTDPFTRIQSAVAAGSSVEYLARCVVLAGDPLLLALPSHLESRLALSRIINPTAFNPKLLRTISATEAVKVVSTIHPTVFKSSKLTEDVFALRNSAAHMAMALEEDLAADMIKMVLVVSELLEALEENEDSFWGTNLREVARFMKKQATDDIAIRVASKLAAARERYEELVARFSNEENLKAMLAIWENRDVPYAVDEDGIDQRKTCPACTSSGYLSYTKEVDSFDYDVEVDDEGHPHAISATVSFNGIPTMFQCPVCSLRLDARELDSFPALNHTIQLPEEVVDDPSEYYNDADWEGL